jgi:hypothetical protein
MRYPFRDYIGNRKRIRERIGFFGIEKKMIEHKHWDHRNKRGSVEHAIKCGSSRTKLTQSRRETAIYIFVFIFKSLTECGKCIKIEQALAK